MSKITLVSDIHLDSYPNRTPSPEYRLNQSYQVAKNIVNRSKENDSEYIFFLGDILEKQNRDSDVHSAVKGSLEYIMKHYKAGYYILGNHDMKARSLMSEGRDSDMISSYLHLYMPDNLYYMDRKVLEIDGVTFGFRNYSAAETLDLSFIKRLGHEKIDVLIGHSPQSYQDGDPPYPVQKYDESLVDMAFFGHIHQSVCRGSKASVGVAQRCKITDDRPRVIIYDTLLKTWKYVDLDPEGKLMDLQESTTLEEDYFDPVRNIWFIAKKKPTKNAELLKAVTSTGYDKIFEAEIQARGLTEVHKIVKDSTPIENLERLDLNFKIISVIIHNWRSIADQTINFKDSGKYLVKGINGSGKSSLYSALSFGISGKCLGQPKDNIRHGKKDMYVEVSLEYRGSRYQIHRGTDKIEVYKDGKVLELGNKTQTKEGIIKELPFIEAMDIFYYNEGNQRILGQSSSSDTTKLQIIYKILGLNEIDAYNSVAQKILSKLTKEYEAIHENYLISEATLLEKGNYLKSLELQYSGASSKFDPTSRILELRETLDKYQKLYWAKQEYDRQTQENSRVSTEIALTSGVIKELENKLGTLRTPNKLGERISEITEELGKAREDLSGLLKIQSDVAKLQARLEVIVKEGTKIKNDLLEMADEISKPVICKSYGIPCPAVTEEMKKKSLETRTRELENSRNQKLLEYKEVSDNLEKLKFSQEDISRLTEKVSDLQAELTGLEKENQEYLEVTERLSKKKKYLSELKSKMSGVSILPPELPVDLLTRMSSLNSEISTLEGYQRLRGEYKLFESRHLELKGTHDKASKSLGDYQEYISLTKPSGVVYTKIFEIIMTSFSDSKVRYEVNITRRGESRYINILAYLKKNGSEVSYSGASQGEKCMMDIHFLSNFKVKFGLLILDEFLGNLDSENHDEALKKMQALETNLLFVTSHKENLISFPNYIEATLSGDETKYSIG